MDLGVHLPLIRFGDDELSHDRLAATVDAARECGFAAVSSNDHLVFQRPWLDGPTALASVIERSGEMTLATTVALSTLRGPVALAKALAAIDLLSGGRLVAALGPGSSQRDHELVGLDFEDRWKQFEESVAVLRALLERTPPPKEARYYPLPADLDLSPAPAHRVPLWIGSWGSKAGLARVKRVADGWLASAYNTTPEVFATARAGLPEGFPNALATMWTWVTDDRAERDRVLNDVLVPMLKRDPAELQGQVCVGTPGDCARLLFRYAEAGCERVYLWPLGDERRQLERVASDVVPLISR
jgi:alkanesulfonate monooxygenase SsuD/methylene tetrahydromethanopterin reductase-like flavin-dependent oxidoreductase (luciferase family)